HDLDMRRKETCACQSIARGTDRAPAGAGSRIELALCQTQQRQSWLRIEARATRLTIGGLGRAELAAQTVNLRLLIVGPSPGFARDVAPAPSPRGGGSRNRLGPRATQLQDLGAVHETVPCEDPKLRVRLAPACERRGPLPYTIERKHPLAACNRCAVDDPR